MRHNPWNSRKQRTLDSLQANMIESVCTRKMVIDSMRRSNAPAQASTHLVRQHPNGSRLIART